MAGVRLAIRLIDEREIAVVIKIICVAIMNAAGIEPQERILSKEQRTSGTHPHVKLDAVVTVAVYIAFPVG